MRIDALPLVFCLLAVPSFAVTHGAAQTEDADATTQMARKRFEDGVKLYDKADYSRAAAAFRQAWALKRHPAVLLNLAQSELRAGNHVSAARHFVQYIHEYPETPPDQQATAKEGLTEARKMTGRLDIIVSDEGAEILVDGVLVGRSPLPGVVDVEPGAHEVEVKLPGFEPFSEQVALTAGSTNTVNAELGRPSGGEPAVPEHVGEKESGRKSFIRWAQSDPVAWGTLGVTGLGLYLGVAFAYVTSGRVNDADKAASRISATASRDAELANYQGLDRRSNPCADPVPVTADTDYRPACSNLKGQLQSRDNSRQWMWVGFGAAAAGVVSTGAAYYLRSRPEGDDDIATPDSLKKRQATLVPLWTPDMQGIGVLGDF